MLTEADLKRCAMYLIELHGAAAAAARASIRATELYERGDRDAADIWFQIGAMIERKQAEKA